MAVTTYLYLHTEAIKMFKRHYKFVQIFRTGQKRLPVYTHNVNHRSASQTSCYHFRLCWPLQSDLPTILYPKILPIVNKRSSGVFSVHLKRYFCSNKQSECIYFHENQNAIPTNARITSHLCYNRSPIANLLQCGMGYDKINYIQTRHFSDQSSIGSIAQTQVGFYKFLSESAPVLHTQEFLAYIHNLSGLPWWATIILTTVLLRMVITFPLAIYQNYILAKVENLTLEMPGIVQELKKETAYAMKKFNWTQPHARITYNRSLKKQWNKLVIRDNCHPAKASILLFVQLPMWVFLSVALRNLVYMLPHHDIAAQITCLELSVGGFVWIPNLIAPDTSWILPVTLGLTNLAIIELQALSKVKKSGKFQIYATNFFRVISIVMIPVAASVPACMSLYWVTSSVFGLTQNLVLLSPRVKRVCGIPDTPTMREHPYQHIVSQIQERAASLSSWSKDKS